MVLRNPERGLDRDILTALAADGPLERSELARITGRSVATVSRAVERLRVQRLVSERSTPPGRRGRPPRSVELRPEAGWVVGIDAGGSMLRAVRADLEGVVRARSSRQATDPADPATLVADLLTLIDAVRPTGDGAFLAVAAGVSGIVAQADGRVLVSPDLPGLTALPLAEILEARVGAPVAIDNDDLLAAVGEASKGAARGCRDVVFLSFGYGLGAGLIVDGRPVRGASSAAGAIAFLGRGRLEDRASGRAIPLRYVEACDAARERGDPFARLDAQGVFDLARGGDPVAKAVVGQAVEAIADAVLEVAALLDPEVIVVGGGLVGAGPILTDTVEQRLRSVLPYPPRIALSTLEGGAVLEGAVSLALALGRQAIPTGRSGAAPTGRRPALELV